MKAKNTIFTKNSSVFIATFSHYEKGQRMPRNGMVDQLLSFFLPKVKMLLLLDQPHVISDSVNPIIEIFIQGKLKKRFIFSSFYYFLIYLWCKLPSKNRTKISYKIRDIFSVIFIGITQKNTFDLFIGLEAINTFGGIFLKKIGKVKTVVYYVSDYSPVRFGNTWFNSLYIWLDQFCVRHADFTWDVSSIMKEGRKKTGLTDKDMQRVIHVQNGLFESQIGSVPIEKRIPNSLVYMGTLDNEFGVDFAIKNLIKIKEKIPHVSLHIIGGGRNIIYLKDLVKKLKLEESVVFYGYVMDNNEMAKIVRHCAIGIAPLRSFPDSYLWYGDAGKIRVYLANGLPVVTTNVPPLGRQVAQEGAAIMTKDTIEDFSKGIITLLKDKILYKKLSDKAKKISKENTWENSYKKAIREMEQKI